MANERSAFTVERIGENGRPSFVRMVAFAEALLGRPLTPEERARQRERWQAKFPETSEPNPV